MPNKLVRIAVVSFLLSIASEPARAIDLKQAREIARGSTISLNVVANTCDNKAVNNLKATGFLINSGGYVLTAAHLFGSSTCPHRDIEIIGIHGQQRWGDVEDAATLSLVLAGSPDFGRDLAILQIQGAVPNTLKPLRVCSNYTPTGAESQFAFGHPFGKPLVPLELTYSAMDGATGYWLVSGLTTGGMSGGPVLDEYGNAVALIQGGLAQSVPIPQAETLPAGNSTPEIDIPIHALQFVAPLTKISDAFNQVVFNENCGRHRVATLPTFYSARKPTWDDQQICGFRLPTEFQIRRRKNGVAVVSLDPSQSDSVYAGLNAARFQLEIERLAIPQYGLNNSKYNRNQDVLACEAASLWIDTYGEDKVIADATLPRPIALATRNDSVLPSSNDRCYESSDWPSTLLRGGPIESSMLVRVAMNERPSTEPRPNALSVVPLPMAFSVTRNGFIGSLFIYSPNRSLVSAQIAFKDRKDPLREIFDSDSESKLFALHLGCEAYDNMDFQDFKRLCASLATRLLAGDGNDSGKCLEEHQELQW